MNVLPYGDSQNDGRIQLAFTLHLPFGDRARETARQLCLSNGLRAVEIAHMEDFGGDFTYFVITASFNVPVDLESITVRSLELPAWTRADILRQVDEGFSGPIVVVGACTGSDAHTVGLDAILNFKGCSGESGLESYSCFEVHNLGAQVANDALLDEAERLGAHAILVSQVVTQRGMHIQNMKALIDGATRRGIRGRTLLVVGGPRVEHAQAFELGYDGGFGAGTTPTQVASFIAQEVIRRHRQA